MDPRCPPSLVVTKQTALTEDKVTTRGKTHSVYVVVKNSPFQMTVALKNCVMNLKQLAFDITLIYDIPDYNKEVAYVSTKPVDYKPCINEAGDEISFDAKISALSSQHEDSFFRLKITIWDPNNFSFPQLLALSHPIKVISKPMNQRKPRKKITVPNTGRRSSKAKTESSQSLDLATNAPAESSLNRPCSAVPTELLDKIDFQQQQTLQLLHQLLLQSSQEPAPAPVPAEQRPIKRQKVSPVDGSESSVSVSGEFENAFSMMLQCYTLMSAEEKATSARRMMRTLSVRDTEQLEELMDIMHTSGIKTEQRSSSSYPSGNPPFQGFVYPPIHELNDCFRSELARIDQFYNEDFSNVW